MNVAAKAKKTQKDKDGKLVKRAREGDARAFTRLVRAYEARVFGHMSVRLANPSSAEQMVTAVFRRMYSDLQSSEEFGEFEEELFKLVELKLLQLRGRPGAGWTEVCLAFDRKASRLPSLKDSVRQRLTDSIAGLDMAERQALDLRYGSGLPLDQVSKRLKRSEDAVKGVLAGALGTVKKALRSIQVGKKEIPGKRVQTDKSKGQRGKNG